MVLTRLVAWLVGVMALFWVVLVPIFERFAPPRVVRAYQRLTMPMFRPWAGIVPGWAVIETTGRKTGLPRRTPVAARIKEDACWVVAGIGRKTNYVRNIEAAPRVRVRTHGRWYAGTAHLCPDDEARKRSLRLNPVNGLFLWLAGGDQLTVRIDLDPA